MGAQSLSQTLEPAPQMIGPPPVMGTTPSPTPTATVAPTIKTGTAKTFPSGAKTISISGPETVIIGTPAIYKVSRAGSYASWPWVGEDSFQKIIFKVTDPSNTLSNFNSPDDTYTLNATQEGKYSILAFVLKLGECYDQNECPSVTITVNAVKTAPTSTPTPSSSIQNQMSSVEMAKINNKLNSLRNQLVNLGTSMSAIESQVTSMKNVSKNVTSILKNTDSITQALQSAASGNTNTAATPASNNTPASNATPESNSNNAPTSNSNNAPTSNSNAGEQAGGKRRTTRRNKLKRKSKLRKTRSKV